MKSQRKCHNKVYYFHHLLMGGIIIRKVILTMDEQKKYDVIKKLVDVLCSNTTLST